MKNVPLDFVFENDGVNDVVASIPQTVHDRLQFLERLHAVRMNWVCFYDLGNLMRRSRVRGNTFTSASSSLRCSITFRQLATTCSISDRKNACHSRWIPE